MRMRFRWVRIWEWILFLVHKRRYSGSAGSGSMRRSSTSRDWRPHALVPFTAPIDNWYYALDQDRYHGQDDLVVEVPEARKHDQEQDIWKGEELQTVRKRPSQLTYLSWPAPTAPPCTSPWPDTSGTTSNSGISLISAHFPFSLEFGFWLKRDVNGSVNMGLVYLGTPEISRSDSYPIRSRWARDKWDFNRGRGFSWADWRLRCRNKHYIQGCLPIVIIKFMNLQN